MVGLSHLQKRNIAIAARAAYQAWPEREAFEAINSEISRTECFEAWRHVEQGKAVGIQSLRECTQAHYARVLAHFQRLAGRADAAIRTIARDDDNDRRIALFKLREECTAAGLSEAYAAAICRRQYLCELAAASDKQVWRLVYTIRNRASSKRKHSVASQTRDPDPF